MFGHRRAEPKSWCAAAEKAKRVLLGIEENLPGATAQITFPALGQGSRQCTRSWAGDFSQQSPVLFGLDFYAPYGAASGGFSG